MSKQELNAFLFSGPKPSQWGAGSVATIMSGPKSAAAKPSAKAKDDQTAQTLIAQVKAWKPSEGHSGSNTTSLKPSADDLMQVVNWALSTGKYFVKKGLGTGDYADKPQLKIIHKTVVAAGGKKATYHFRVKESVLAALELEVED